MAALIERMAYTGATPWHGIGAHLSDPTNVDQCFAEAGLLYEATLTDDVRVNGELVDFARAITRSTDGKCVGIVGTGFAPLQTASMANFLRPWVASGKATVETAGSLRGGKTVWALAKIAGACAVGDGDEIERYILIAQAHDGTMAIRAGLTPIRVVCNNTLGGAVSIGDGKRGGLIKIPHTAGATLKLEQVESAMTACDLQWERLTETYRAMTQVMVSSEKTVRAFVRAVFGERKANENKTEEEKALLSRPREDAIVGLFEAGTGADLSSAKGTAWGLYNALTEYVTHASATKTGVSKVAGRVESLSFGQGSQRLNRGLALIEEILDHGRLAAGRYSIEEVFGAGSPVVQRVQEATWAAA
jgi:phage/plasmid-like protein (TIGR03299 family)